MDHLLELVKLMRHARHGVKFRIWFDPTDGDRLTFHLLLHEDLPKMKVQRGGQTDITFEAIDRDAEAALEKVLSQFCKCLKNTLDELEDGTDGKGAPGNAM